MQGHSIIIVRGTSEGWLSEFFKKELRDIGILHGKMDFLNRIPFAYTTIICLYLRLVELGCLKNSGS